MNMKVNGLNGVYINPVNSKKKSDGVAYGDQLMQKTEDKISISNEARQMQVNQTAPRDLSEIRQRLSSGYYKSDEVTGKVADSILKELGGK